MCSLNVVLKSPPPDVELQQLIETTLVGWKWKLGLLLVYRGVINEEPGMLVQSWKEARDPEVEVQAVFDDIANFRYITAIAPDQNLCERMWRQLKSDFETVLVDELRSAVRREADRDANAFMRLAVGLSAQFDSEALSLVREGLQSADVAVRAGAAEAAAMLHWLQLAGDVKAALARETDEGVANVLKLAADIIQKSSQQRSDRN
jgi:hypothetical protein